MSGPMPVLQATGLMKSFPLRRGVLQRVTDRFLAVDRVDLAIPPESTIGLVGESGCGKTTVARLLMRLMALDAGEIHFDGEPVQHLTQRDFKPYRRKIQMIFQDPQSSLNPRMTVARTLTEGLRVTGIHDRQELQRRTLDLLEQVGMPRYTAKRYPHEFSGGQRQRIGIARALSVSPSILICDEPISALDVSIQAQIINLLADLQSSLGLSMLFISHDLNVVSYLCHHVCVMHRGRIVESAPTNALFANPRHPYTHRLLSALPLTDRLGQLPEIKELPELESHLTRPDGCPYLDDCDHADDRCQQAPDTMVTVGTDHQVRCWAPPGANGDPAP